MYLDYFKFSEVPFGLTPNINFFCRLAGHQEALNVILFSIRSGEGFIKIVGEVGAGKTLLCRKVLDSLSTEFVTAYIPNPDLTPNELRRAFAREIGVDLTGSHDPHELLTLIQHHLVRLHDEGKRIVLLLDEAQALSVESLEALRLLTNLETEKNKLLQVILFGQPELDTNINRPQLRQLKQRITFSYYLPLLTREDLDTYLFHRLGIAGYTGGPLFAKRARDLLYRASRGVPRLVNILCHKALLVAYGSGQNHITYRLMRSAIRDTDLDVTTTRTHRSIYLYLIAIGILVGLTLWLYVYNGII